MSAVERATDIVPSPDQVEPGSIANIYLEPFERAVYARNHEVAGQMLIGLLAHLRLGAEVIGYRTDEQTKTVLYTRLAACITALVSDPKFQLSQSGFDKMASEHATIDAIFRASAFEASDHLARQFSETDPAGKLRFRDSPNLAKFLMTYSLSSALQLNFEKLFQVDSRVTFPLFAGMLSHLSVLSAAAHDRREHILGLSHLFEKVSADDSTLLVMSDAYMYCSYAVRRDKHEVKRVLNRILRRYMRRHMPEIDTPPVVPKRDRPVLLVALEWFTSLHAMYRCFQPALLQLKQRYRLVGAGRERDTDEAARAMFDEWLTVPGEGNLVGVARMVRTLAPDIILYPSVGMSLWWVAMSACRLAPIQIAGVGHPASTFSPEMDYLIAERGTTVPDLVTETLVEIPSGSTRFVMRQDALLDLSPMSVTTGAEEIAVAIPAMASKLSMPFLRLLQRVEARVSPRRVIFHFFPNMMGVTQFLLEKEMRRWLRSIVVHGRLTYTVYQERLRLCELHLSPYPFGGTNSNIDSMMLGVPMIALRGDEPHASIDGMMLDRIGMPDMAVATEQEYEDLAAWLLTDDHRRAVAAERVRAADLQAAFFGEGPPEVQGAWLRAVRYIEENHDRIRKTKRVEVP